MTRKLINGHRDVCCPEELEVGPLAKSLLMSVERTVGRVTPAAERPERVRSEVRRYLDDLLGTAASLRGKRFWCQKHHDDARFIPAIHRVYPEARYICLYRNCMDVVNSILEHSRRGRLFTGVVKYLHDGNVVEAAIRYWIERFSNIRAFELNHPDLCIPIKYESLVFNPRRELKRVFTLLGLDWYESLTYDGLKVEKEGDGAGAGKVSGTRRIQTDRVGTGRRISLTHIGDSLRREMNQTLDAIGYPMVEDDFNTAASAYIPESASSDPNSPTGKAKTDASLKQIEKFLQSTVRNVNASSEMAGSFKLVVDDLSGGTWILDLGRRKVTRGDGNAACTIALGSQTLLNIAEGTINMSEARIDGKIRTSGDIDMVNRIGKLL